MRKIMLKVEQPSGRTTTREVDPPADSRVGRFFFPQGVEGVFGQIASVELVYTDGHTRKYYVED